MWRLRLGKEPELDLEPVIVNGKSYPVDALFTEGRTASASLKDERIVIRIPRFTRTAEAERLFSSLKVRISRMMERHPERFEKHTLAFRHGQVLSINGKSFPIIVEDSFAGRASARVHDDKIVAKVPLSATQPRNAIVTKVVTRALCRAFLPLITTRVNELSGAHLGVGIRRVVLKDISSRWGSYSRKSGSISLSVKLLFAPPEILDYVIVHELCHAKVQSHGRKFWSLVSSILPDCKERSRWLHTNGDMLGRAEPVAMQIESVPESRLAT